MNKVVARFVDGQILKGFTNDFNPGKDQFHVRPEGTSLDTAPLRIRREDLKALFFVKDFAGNPQHEEKKDFDPAQKATGRKIRVVFKDGEVLIGTTVGYQRDRPGFFLESVDDESNIARCFVVTGATREIAFV
ncbi:MAG: hypothetical protein OEX18_13415 [Candidatus Krumholzibacteria bacterium]|nr:hypothetical protein [Candidatus Krumholzibacteria bacterium]MDH4338265.1 hypothetical protein [Candidatus Krumholzibacteria bacterium]MDH5271063.1 hypothetical protein [Candidatus Krumholzibacteria bacterium]